MSFFIKPKQQKSPSKLSLGQRTKRKAVPDDEVSSSESENEENRAASADCYLSEEEDETVQGKKLRLAKMYLEEIEKEERRRLEDRNISKEIISKRLKIDQLKQTGLYEYKVADDYTGANEASIKILKCKEQRNTITCLCVSSDSLWIFSGSKNGVVVKWSLEEKKKLGLIPFTKSFNQIKGHTGCIYTIAISTDSKFLAVADSSTNIQIWDPNTLSHIRTFKGHKNIVTGLCFKHNSHIFYSCSNDKTIKVWSLDEPAIGITLFGHQGNITAIDVLTSERPISAGGTDGSVRRWNVNNESHQIFNSHSENIDCLKLMNEHYFVTGGDCGQISTWSCLKKKPICSVKAAHGVDSVNSQPFWISAVASYVYSDVIASGSQNGYIRLWKIGDKCRGISKLFEIPVTGVVNSLSFAADGKVLVAGVGKDHKMGRWKTIGEAQNGVYVIPLNVKC